MENTSAISSKFLLYTYLALLLLIVNETILFGGGSPLDEVLLLFSFIILLFYGVRDVLKFGKYNKIYVLVLSFFFYSIFLYFWSPYSASFSLMLAQTGIVIKPFIIMLVILRLFRNIEHRMVWLKRAIVLQIGLVLFCLFINLVLRSSWNQFLGVEVQYRYDILQLIGIFNGPGNLGDFLIMLTISFLGLGYYRSNQEWLIKNSTNLLKYFSLVLLLVLLFVGVRKPIFMTVPLGYYLYKYGFFSIKNRFFFQFAVSISIVGIILITSTDVIDKTVNNLSGFSNPESGYIRGLMFFHGVSLFFTNFPFGVSAATFGSNLSIFNTMSVYEVTGLASTRFLRGEDVFGIFDSGLASFIAEFGFIGLISYYFFIKEYLTTLENAYKVSLQVKMLTIYILIITIFAPGIFNGTTTAIYCLLSMYLFNEQTSRKKEIFSR
jgi:hypothetical protein